MLGLAKGFGTMKVPVNQDQNGTLCDPTNHFAIFWTQAAEKATFSLVVP